MNSKLLLAIGVLIGGGVALLIQTINMIFTFTFGMEVIQGFLLGNIIGEQAASILSGVVCVIFFDFSWMSGLFVFIFVAKGFWQRGAVALQSITCFAISIGASIVALLYLTPLGETLPDLLQLAMSGAGVFLVIGAFLIDSLATVFMIIFDPYVGQVLKEATRRSNEIDFQNQVDFELDRQIFVQAAQDILPIIPPLATWKASQWRNDFLSRLGIGGAELPTSPTPPPQLSPNTSARPLPQHLQNEEESPDPLPANPNGQPATGD